MVRDKELVNKNRREREKVKGSVVSIYSTDVIPNYGKSRNFGKGELIGGTHCNLLDYGGFTFRSNLLCSFYVEENYRKQGKARKLFRHAKRVARALGFNTIHLYCVAEHVSMYKSFGCSIVDAKDKCKILMQSIAS